MVATASAAPVAPGRLGEAIPAEALLTYQSHLATWLTERRAELGRLDTAAQRAANAQTFTGDVVLAMSMWQSVSTGTEQLRQLWDSGRADAVARERMSRVIWGRLDGAQVPGVGADPSTQVSLVEATRLCDALIAQLRAARPQLPLLMLTASGSVSHAVAAMRAGATDTRGATWPG